MEFILVTLHHVAQCGWSILLYNHKFTISRFSFLRFKKIQFTLGFKFDTPIHRKEGLRRGRRVHTSNPIGLSKRRRWQPGSLEVVDRYAHSQFQVPILRNNLFRNRISLFHFIHIIIIIIILCSAYFLRVISDFCGARFSSPSNWGYQPHLPFWFFLNGLSLFSLKHCSFA